jgi:TnpA family transposase
MLASSVKPRKLRESWRAGYAEIVSVRFGGEFSETWCGNTLRRTVLTLHVAKQALCIYSQLKAPSSSEVAAMIEGVLRHGTEQKVDRNFVDTHGQSEVGFAFCHLLGFQLMPRFKNIHAQKLALADEGDTATYPHLKWILQQAIDWELIRKQYDEMVKYATALRLGTAEAESILKRFTRTNHQHPTYKALAELGRALKTIFLYVIWNWKVSTM